MPTTTLLLLQSGSIAVLVLLWFEVRQLIKSPTLDVLVQMAIEFSAITYFTNQIVVSQYLEVKALKK